MRPVLLFILLSLIATCKTKPERNEPQSDTTRYSTNVAYSRGEYIYYYAKKLEKHGTLFNCYDPSLSPDGSKLAYTEYYESDNTNAAGSNRRINILDFETGVVQKITYNSRQNFGPVWSNDSKQIAFNALINGNWSVVLVDANLTYYKVLQPRSIGGYYSISWTSSNTAVLVHNLDTLFIIDTSNVINQKYSIAEITNNANKSSAMLFTLTPDGKSLIFTSENIDASLCNNQNDFHTGLPDAIFKYDLERKSRVKLSPDTLYCADYEIHGDIIYFSASKKCHAFKTSVYKIDSNGTNLELFIKDADNITVARAGK